MRDAVQESNESADERFIEIVAEGERRRREAPRWFSTRANDVPPYWFIATVSSLLTAMSQAFFE
jgi:hypothetical protein